MVISSKGLTGMRVLTTGEGEPPAVLSHNLRIGFAYYENSMNGGAVLTSVYDEKSGIRSTNAIPYQEFIEMANVIVRAREDATQA